nr:putative ribonuclease H-like domain-containing protein [Tanacetum cinerariifolium]
AGRSIPAASRNGSASIYAGRSITAASRNKPVYIHAGKHIPAGRINKPTPFPAGRYVPTGWNNPTARPFFRPIKLYFDNTLYAMGFQEQWWISSIYMDSHLMIHKAGSNISIVDSGCSRSMTRNKEKLDDFVQLKGDIQPEQHINCLLAKASLEESTKWHRRMVRVNFKTINKLAKHGLVEGLPLKLFTNEHNCVACNKEKQHKSSYKAISAVRTISKPLKLLHMDLFGPTSIESINHKYYSLVVTDDFSRFCWAFFMGTKDETFYILKDFIALIVNQLNKKVKAIRCDNDTEFRNAKLIALCEEKGIKRDYSNARTPQQNGVAERKNRILIEAARSMLDDSKLPTMFWTEAISSALVILNTSDHLGKFKGKANDGFLVGYAAHSKAYRVYNLCSKKVEEMLNLRYLEDKPNVQGLGQKWYFDLDYLTDSLGYTCFKTNPPAGTHDTNILAGPTVHDVSAPMKNNLDYAEELARLQRQEYEAHSAAVKHGFEFFVDTEALLPQAEIEIRRNLVPSAGDPAGSIVPSGGVPAGSVPASGVPAGGVLTGSSVPASGVPASSVLASSVPAGGVLAGSIVSAEFGDPTASAFVPAMFSTDPAATSLLPPGHSLGSCDHTARFPSPSDLGNHQPTAGIFSSSSYDDDFCADVTNLALNVAMDPVATKRVDTIHPQSQIIGALQSPVQTRKPSSVAKALEDPDWVAAMQEEMQQFYNQQVWKLIPLPAGKIAIGTKWILKNKRDARGIIVRNKARLVAQGHRQEEGIDYDEVFASVARIEAIHLFLAFASYIGFMVYQIDVKSAFLYGEIEEEVYVT